MAGLKDVVEIAAGLWHNLARQENGDLWAWGYNFWGQLGTGDRRPRLAPVKLGFKDATAIAAGAHHSLAIMTVAETGLWAWGANLDGQLGRGTKDDHSPLPVRVFATPKGTIPTYQNVAAGLDHSLALRSDGVVMAWGRNLWGQLGDGTTQGRPDPAEVKPPLPRGQGAILQIAAGGGFSFARASGVPADKDAGVWAWGFNGRRELGDGTTATYRPLPVRVVGPGGKGLLTKVSAHRRGYKGNQPGARRGRHRVGVGI